MVGLSIPMVHWLGVDVAPHIRPTPDHFTTCGIRPLSALGKAVLLVVHQMIAVFGIQLLNPLILVYI